MQSYSHYSSRSRIVLRGVVLGKDMEKLKASRGETLPQILIFFPTEMRHLVNFWRALNKFLILPVITMR